MILILLVIVLVLCLYFFRDQCAKGVAMYPNKLPVLGHALEFTKDMYALIVNIGKQSVDSNGIIALFYGILPVYVISDPVKATLVLNTCLEKSIMYKLINPLFGDTLVSAAGSVWKRNRRILDHAFKAQVLEGYMAVFNAQASRLLQIIDTKAETGYVDFTNDITRNILETTCKTTMGPLQDDKYVNESYVQACHTVFAITTYRLQKPWMYFDFLFYFSKAKTDLYKALDVIFETSSKMVALRKSEYFERLHKNKSAERLHDNGKFVSVLDIVIAHSMTENGSVFTNTQLRYLCDNILLAAFDTTTYELLFILICIGSDEEVQRKIWEEIEVILADEETVRNEHLPKLVYLEAAIKEAIRLYPIGPVVARRATEAVQLGNITLPPGSEIAVHLWAINRSKKLWGADADDFNPDRWLNPSTLPQHPNAFGSFSFGRRNCIGKKYAMMLLKTTLVPILRKYRIIADHTKMEFECFIMLKAKAGHLIKFKLR